ncbi:hypothetical protein AB0I10_04850 [Streptomyces sp. NPDC050636]
MAEKRIFLWYVSMWKGNKVKWTSDEKMLRTSWGTASAVPET